MVVVVGVTGVVAAVVFAAVVAVVAVVAAVVAAPAVVAVVVVVPAAVLAVRCSAEHWPTLTLLPDANRADRYENTATGHRIAATVGGKGGTGEGGDVLILDDPQQPTVAASATQRAKAIDWYRDTLASRFNDPRTYVQIVIMQRLHEADLAGYLIEQGGWEHLCVPARYEPSHPFVWPGDPRTEEGQLMWRMWWLNNQHRVCGCHRRCNSTRRCRAAARGDLARTASTPAERARSRIIEGWRVRCRLCQLARCPRRSQ